MSLLDKLQELENIYEDLTARLADPAIFGDQSEANRLLKNRADLEDVVMNFREYKALSTQQQETKSMLEEPLDDEMRSLAYAELEELHARQEKLEADLHVMLLPKDPNDEKDVIIEIRAGTGGDEAALFAGDLLRMYTRYAERQGWKTELLDSNPTGIGGFKEVSLGIKGRGAYSRMKFESGTHRVQRVPATESQGRIHTSAATVAVLPEAEEVDIQISNDDLQIDTFRAGSAGGQHMQKNETAVRITHLPTNTVAQCQDERSQFQNKEKAMRVLRSLLLKRKIDEQNAEISEARKALVGSGDRSDKVRTYNFPQGRITDHRIGFTVHRLEGVLDGDIDDITQALISADQAEKLKAAGENAELAGSDRRR